MSAVIATSRATEAQPGEVEAAFPGRRRGRTLPLADPAFSEFLLPSPTQDGIQSHPPESNRRPTDYESCQTGFWLIALNLAEFR